MLSLRITFVLLFSIISVSLIHSKLLKGRIINGYKASKGQFPWFVLLLLTSNAKDSICGGSLISEKWVLTASHCLKGTLKVYLFFGIVHIHKTNYLKRISTKFFVNPKFNKNFDHDIGLITFSKSVKYSYSVRPIRLAKRSMTAKYLIDKVCTISGFGIHNMTTKTSPLHLLYTNARIVSHNICSRKYSEKISIKYQVCGVNLKKNQHLCIGDSGGGLVLNKGGKSYVVGVVSFGKPNCKYYPTIYQLVSSNIDWILRHTKIKY